MNNGQDSLELKPGDHLFIDCQGYSHHGIYVGQDRVVHFESTPVRKFLGPLQGDPPRICEVSLSDFARGRQWIVREYADCSSGEEAVERAQSRVGEQGYDLFDNNCEHFAVWCKTGQSHSSQVQSACSVAQTGAAGIAIGTAIIKSAKGLPGPYRVLAYGAGAAIAIGSTTYRIVVERKRNRENRLS